MSCAWTRNPPSPAQGRPCARRGCTVPGCARRARRSAVGTGTAHLGSGHTHLAGPLLPTRPPELCPGLGLQSPNPVHGPRPALGGEKLMGNVGDRLVRDALCPQVSRGTWPEPSLGLPAGRGSGQAQGPRAQRPRAAPRRGHHSQGAPGLAPESPPRRGRPSGATPGHSRPGVEGVSGKTGLGDGGGVDSGAEGVRAGGAISPSTRPHPSPQPELGPGRACPPPPVMLMGAGKEGLPLNPLPRG